MGTRSSAGRLAAAALLLTAIAVVIGTPVRSPTEIRGDHVEPGSTVVQIDLYSGRPNPRFSLQPPPARQLMNRLAALPPTDARSPSVPLGYRGLRVETDQSGSMNEIQIYHGIVTVQQPDGTKRTLSDPNRDTERWLIDLGAANLNQDEVAFLHNELRR